MQIDFLLRIANDTAQTPPTARPIRHPHASRPPAAVTSRDFGSRFVDSAALISAVELSTWRRATLVCFDEIVVKVHRLQRFAPVPVFLELVLQDNGAMLVSSKRAADLLQVN